MKRNRQNTCHSSFEGICDDEAPPSPRSNRLYRVPSCCKLSVRIQYSWLRRMIRKLSIAMARLSIFPFPALFFMRNLSVSTRYCRIVDTKSFRCFDDLWRFSSGPTWLSVSLSTNTSKLDYWTIKQRNDYRKELCCVRLGDSQP